jgi:hypothetical protein
MLEGRVGSTLMMELLGSSPAIAFDRSYPFENSYLTYLVRLLRQAASNTGEYWTVDDLLYSDEATAGPLPFRPTTLDLGSFTTRSLAALWQVLSDSLRDSSPNQLDLYAEKYWGSVAPVLDAGITPIIIDLVRDPRDVLVSIRAFNAQRGGVLFGRSRTADDVEHMHHIVVGMAFRLHELTEPLPVARQLIRYEDLVHDMDGCVATLSSLLNVELDPQSALSYSGNMAHHATSPSAEDSVGRWRNELDPSDIAFIERKLGAHMEKLGYTLSTAE